MITRPMLAATVKDAAALRYPLIGSPKLDGIRALTINGQLLSRTLKPIANDFVRERLRGLPDGLDGELIAGNTFGETSSAIMSRDGEPAFWFCVFDYVLDLNAPYDQRLQWLLTLNLQDPCIVVPTQEIRNPEELLVYETYQLSIGFEGVMLRDPVGGYKCGRSTLKEQGLLKLKRFEDAEAEVIGFIELYHNTNEAVTNELGLTKRSSAKAGKVPGDTLGALVLKRPDGVTFECGAGFTEAQRRSIWEGRAALVGKLAKFKHQPHGAKDRPRLPVFLGFRDARDL